MCSHILKYSGSQICPLLNLQKDILIKIDMNSIFDKCNNVNSIYVYYSIGMPLIN